MDADIKSYMVMVVYVGSTVNRQKKVERVVRRWKKQEEVGTNESNSRHEGRNGTKREEGGSSAKDVRRSE